MLDSGKALPYIVELASLDKPGQRVPVAKIASSLSAFEGEMIPRAFAWVKKSGGDNFVVSRDPFKEPTTGIREAHADILFSRLILVQFSEGCFSS